MEMLWHFDGFPLKAEIFPKDPLKDICSSLLNSKEL